ncbi:unnamed protein product [Ectocarpus sp. 8 AP-2014]
MKVVPVTNPAWKLPGFSNAYFDMFVQRGRVGRILMDRASSDQTGG